MSWVLGRFLFPHDLLHLSRHLLLILDEIKDINTKIEIHIEVSRLYIVKMNELNAT